MVNAKTLGQAAHRAHYLTRFYPFLQGYTLLPWLVFFPVIWIMNSPKGSVALAWAMIAIGVPVFFASRAIHNWYATHYGMVRANSSRRQQWAWLNVAVFFGVNGLLPAILFNLLGADTFRHLVRDGPIAWPYVVVGLATTLLSIWLRPAMPNFWLFGLAILGVAALPLGSWWSGLGGRHPFFVPMGVPQLTESTYGQLPFAAWLLAYSLLSHRALTQLLPTPEQSADEEAV